MFKEAINKILKNKYYLIGAISILLLLVITLGTAALRSTLSIIGNNTINENTWIIYFDGIQTVDDSVTPQDGARIVDRAKTRIEFTVDLKPGEIYEYTVDTVNDGTINAMVDHIEKYELSDAQKKYLDFEVIYTDEGLEPYYCTPLPANGGRRELKVTVKYKDVDDYHDFPTTDVHLDLYFDIIYVQDIGCSKNNPYTLTIDPNGGTYNKRTANTVVYLKQNSEIYDDSYTVTKPKKELYNFDGWEVVSPSEDGTYLFDQTTGLFNIGTENVYLRAKWQEGNYVARIEDEYFTTIQAAFNAAQQNKWHDNTPTVWLLKDTTEYPTNNTTKPFIFNLDSHTVTGTITNSSNGNITLLNGRVKADENDEEAFINYGTLNLGLNDGVVSVENSVSIVGNEIGLLNKVDNGAIFNFYDGYIEGTSAIVRGYKNCPEHYVVFINHINETSKQRAYLVNDTTRAVVKIDERSNNEGLFYYYLLQDAIDDVVDIKTTTPSLGDNRYKIEAIRDFEAAYDLTVPENSRVFFDIKGYKIYTGGYLTNNGYFNITNSVPNKGFIRPSKTFTNTSTGELVINDVTLEMTADYEAINNAGKLDIKGTSVRGQHTYAINNNGTGTILFDQDTFIDSKESYGLYNSSSNLNVTDGTIYGFNNTANGATINGNANFEIYHWTTESYYTVHHYIPAITNSGTLNFVDGNVTNNQYDTNMIKNEGTMNISGGTFESDYRLFDNYNGTINITGGDIHGTNNVISQGTVNVSNNAEVSSDNGIVISNGTLTVNTGKVYTTSGTSVYGTDTTLIAGEIYTEDGTAITGNSHDDIDIQGGSVYSLNGAAINGCNVDISGGTIDGTTYGIEAGEEINVSGGTITSTGKAVTCNSISITGGSITSTDDAVTTNDLSMSSGSVISTDEIAITLNGEGLVLDGTIKGNMYGILNNGELTIGEDDGTISPNVPTIIGGSVGVEITGTKTAFFDGILEGQIDGYRGTVTQTPLGGKVVGGSTTIEGVTYQTDFITQFENWLEIEGVGQYDTIDDASSAIADGATATIKVIENVSPSFVQHFVDENHNKNITFDLNGHILTSTQVAYNNDSNVTVIDSLGTGKITNSISHYFENNHNMTIDGITIVSTGNKAVIRNYRNGTLTIEDATITAKTNAIQTMGHTIINDITLTAEQDAIYVECIDTLNEHYFGSVTMNDGTITAGNRGLYGRGSFILNDGSISATNEGSLNLSTTVNGGSIHTVDGVAITGSSITVTGGTVISDNNYGLYADSTISVSGGYVEGTTAITQYPWYDLYSHARYDPVNISGGTVKGNTSYGVDLIGNTLTVTGGEVYGEIDGIKSQADVVLGNNEGTISKVSPLIQGKSYGIKTTGTFSFFDGILKGKVAARDGQVNLVPDASMIIDDYEFIDRVEYKNEYLEPFGNWLRVGEDEFNSLYAAQNVIDDYGTVYVTKDVNINFEQSLVSGKHVTLDLDGHQVMMSKTLSTNGTNTITDSKTTGSLTNVSETEDLAAISNYGTLTIEGGTYSSNRSYAIYNDGTMVVDDINLVTDGAIRNTSTLTINGGHIESTSDSANAIYNQGVLNINGGEITSDTVKTISSIGQFNMTGGTVTSTVSNAIEISAYYNTSNISGGTITGHINGISIGSDNYDVTISGGTIIGETECGVVSNNKNTYVTGGTLKGETYGLSLTNGGTIGIDDRDVKIDNPIIQGNQYGLSVAQGSLYFNDGILKGIDGSELGSITDIPSGTQEYTDSETIDGNNYHTKYLIQEKELAYNVQLDRYYNNLQDAFTDAQENNTIELLTNIPIYYPVTNNNTKAFTLDLKGFNISTNKPITNNYNLTLVDSLSGGSIKASSSINLITNNGTMTIGDVNLINNSTSSYIVRNVGTLTLNNTTITGINGVQSTNNLTINDADITASSNAIDSSGVLNIDGGTYTALNYALYNNGSQANTVENATFNGIVYNYRNQLTLNDCDMVFERKGTNNQYLSNAGTLIINRNNISGVGYTNNSGTMTINDSTINLNSNSSSSNTMSAIYNTGTLTVDNTKVYNDVSNTGSYTAYGVSNSGTATITNGSEIKVGNTTSSASNKNYYGIYATNGTVTVDDTTIEVKGGQYAYGVVVDNANATVNVITGRITAKDTQYSFGAKINSGTFEIGHFDDVSDESALVSITDPYIYSSGTVKGVGVKNVNGIFGFYDGVIWASTHAKPEAANRIENYYEVTTYVDEETTFENAKLEYMGADWDNTVVAMIGSTSYTSLALAIQAYNYNVQPGQTEPDQVIELRKSVDEDINIASGKHVVIDLNGMSLTTSIDIQNNGTLQLYNGTIIEVSDEDNPENNDYINNYGTLILGKDDGIVSSSSIRVISENTAINNIFDDGYIQSEGTLELYDGYIEGNPAINGSITKIADFARLNTKHEAQYERITIQSLSKEAIENGETDLMVTINPNGGTFKGHTEEFIVYLNYVYDNTYELLPEPTKFGCIFAGWEISEPDTYDDNTKTITIGYKDVIVKALWTIDPNVVAKIGDNYYYSIAQAHEAAKTGDVIELIKDVTLSTDEVITITKNITLDLGGYTINGNVSDGPVLINNAILKIDNGRIVNDVNNMTGIGIVNNKTLTIGDRDKNDGEVDINEVYVFGRAVGLEQNGAFHFYDGTLEGTLGLIGGVNSLPGGYYLCTDENESLGTTKVFPQGTPDNAIAQITDGVNSQLFFKLTNAIAAARVSGKEIDIIATKQTLYPITIREDDNIVINMNGNTLTTNNNIIINGTLKIYDKSETKGGYIVGTPIENNGNFIVQDITISQNSNNNTITNNGALTLTGSTIRSLNGYAVNNNGTIDMNATASILGDSYSLYNNNANLVINAGTISAAKIKTASEFNNVTFVSTNSSNACIYPLTGSSLYIDGGSCTSEKYGIDFEEGSITADINHFDIDATHTGIRFGGGTYHDVELDNVNIGLTTMPRYGIYYNNSSNHDTMDITDGHIIGNEYGIYAYYVNEINIDGTTIESKSTQYDYWRAFSCTYSSTCNVENAKIISPNDAAIVDESATATFEDTDIQGGHYGLYASTYSHVDVTSCDIYGKIAGAYVYAYYDYRPYLTIKGGTITSDQYGIYQYGSGTVNLESGSVEGTIYGIKLEYYRNTPILNIGKETDTLSVQSPYITGELYGVFNTDGQINFYNGRLRGSINGYNIDFNNVRRAHDIITYDEHISETDPIKTYSTTNVSDSAIANYAKKNDGYAKVTYIGETNGSCINNTETTFGYTGDEQSLSITCPGKYKLEVWGAQGGSYNASEYFGGYGGYTSAETELSAGETLFIYVGGRGSNKYNNSVDGGYNGGGSAYSYNSYYYVASGGGATHIATSPGLLSELENNKNSILVVAGGGGGGFYQSDRRGPGGAGGGYEGADNGIYYVRYKEYSKAATGGTQTAGGTFGYYFTNSTDEYHGLGAVSNGSFGQGGSYATTENLTDVCGGGGGYYGGGATFMNSAAGGSGYYNFSKVTNGVMYGYNVPHIVPDYKNNILAVKENFIQADDGHQFNNFEDALTYIEENYNKVGRLTFMKSVLVNELLSIPSTYEIELNLGGFDVDMTQTIVNLGKLSISNTVNNVPASTGSIENTKGDGINNQGTLIFEKKVHFISVGNVIDSNTSEGSINIKDNCLLEGKRDIYIRAKQTITITNSVLKASETAITSYYGAGVITMNITGCEINKDVNNGRVALGVNHSSGHTVNITDSYVAGVSLGSCSGTISGTTIEKMTDYNSSSYDTLSLSGSTYTINNHSYIHSGSTALLASSSTVTITDSNVNSDNIGIRTGGENSNYGVTINNSTIYGKKMGVSIGSYYDYRTHVTLNSGSITSDELGIYMEGSGKTYVNGGTVKGGIYGIKMVYYRNNPYLYIGKSTDTLSTTLPNVSGGEYGVYREAGETYLYNGRVMGTTGGYNVDFTGLRPGMTIVETTEYEDPLDTTSTEYKVDYLELMQPFLRADDGQEFNSIEDGITYIENNYSGVGKLTVTRSVTYQQPTTIPSGDQIEINLAGFDVITTQTIINQGKLTISNSINNVPQTTGSIENTKGNLIENQKDLVFDKNVKAKALNDVVYANTNVGTIDVKDGCKFEGNRIFYLEKQQTITVKNSDFKSVSHAIYVYSGSTSNNITLTNTNINADNENGKFAILSYYGTNHILNITGGYIRGISCDNCSGTISGATIERTTDASSSDYDAFYANYSTFDITDNTEIISNKTALNISNSVVTLTDSKVTSNNTRAIYLYADSSNKSLTINNSVINGRKEGIYIYAYYDYKPTLIMNSGKIYSPEVAINMYGSGISNINGGNVIGDIYGIKLTYYRNNPTLNVGSVDNTLSTTVPYIEGALYGVYKEAGITNFYNGRVVGNTYPYYGDFDNVREEHQIYLDNQSQSMDSQRFRTYTTTDYSSTPVSDTPKYGDGFVRITYNDSHATDNPDYIYIDKIIPSSMEGLDLVKSYNYQSDSGYTYNIPTSGYYKLEVWGAQGGGKQVNSLSELGIGGKGGYASGIIHLDTTDQLIIQVGSQGKTATDGIALGGYNGGGATWGSGTGDPAAGGGGATDIRINNDNLYSRVIVAGGGGGGGEDNETGYAGGGLTGLGSYKATQTAAGNGGAFGQGAHTSYDGGGAGGGWYGAGSGGGSQTLPTSNSGNDNNGGSGGSGYVFTSTSDIVEGYQLDNRYQLTNTQLLGGDVNIPIFEYEEGMYEETNLGNSGDGHARISYVGDSISDVTVTLSTNIGTIADNSIDYLPGSELGNIPAPTLTSGYIFDGWYTDTTYTKRISDSTRIYTNATLYAKVLTTSEMCSSTVKKVYEYSYVGREQEFVTACPGEYIIEAWGGSSGTPYGASHGGYGGYSTGKITLETNEKLYINVGGQGKSAFANKVAIPGGYNGGGEAHTNQSNFYYSSGGGATHIATKTGLLSTLENDKDKIIIVAGGGGGYMTNSSTNEVIGGSGGGYAGATGMNSYTRYDYFATGGTQVEPGKSSYIGDSSKGSFGKGGEMPNYSSYSVGGGGGFYGGGASYTEYGAPGGGSGYTGNTRLYDKYMYGYNVDAKNDADTSTIAYLIKTEPFIYNKTLDAEYTDMNEAFSHARNNDEFELKADGSNAVDVEIPNLTLSLDMKGHTLNSMKTIVNKGNLTITNSVANTEPKIYSNLSINLINNTGTITATGVDFGGYNTFVNTGTLNLTNSKVTTMNQGIRNSNTISLSNTSVKGGNYAIYDDSTVTNTITGVTLQSKTAIQKTGAGRLNVGTASITGTINNNGNDSILIIQGGSFNGDSSNKGTLTMSSMTVTYGVDGCSNYQQFKNTGTLTLSSNTISMTNNSSCSTTAKTVYNESTFTSSGNTYSTTNTYYRDGSNYHYRYGYDRVIHNEGILTSTSDIFNITRYDTAYAIYNDSSNSVTITNINSNIDDSYYSYGIYNYTGNVSVAGGTQEQENSIYEGYGIYVRQGSVNAKNYTINSHDNPSSYGVYVESGSYTHETGTITSTGDTAYGIFVNTGTVNIGVSGSGVSRDNPYIVALGTTTGYGVSKGDGSINFYDGKIKGSTNYMVGGNQFANTEDNYDIEEITEADGKACVLKSLYA